MYRVRNIPTTQLLKTAVTCSHGSKASLGVAALVWGSAGATQLCSVGSILFLGPAPSPGMIFLWTAEVQRANGSIPTMARLLLPLPVAKASHGANTRRDRDPIPSLAWEMLQSHRPESGSKESEMLGPLMPSATGALDIVSSLQVRRRRMRSREGQSLPRGHTASLELGFRAKPRSGVSATPFLLLQHLSPPWPG